MRVRIAAIALFFAAFCTGVCWLSLQPLFVPLLQLVHHPVVTRIRSLLPFLLMLDFGVASTLGFLLLHWTVGRPMEKAQEAISRIGRSSDGSAFTEAGGPFLSQLQKELKKTNARLAQTQAELIATERLAMVGKLAAGVAHEIGNPLSGILGYLSLSKSRAQSIPELSNFLERIEAEVQRIDQIVKSLLDLGRSPLEPASSVDLQTLVTTCVDLVSAGSEFKEVRVETHFEPQVIARVRPGPYSQILLNLMLNGAQAMSGVGKLSVRVYPQGGWVITEVLDEGPGIAPDALTHIFEPFFTTKSSGEGTGLGLAVSMHLAQEMGGLLEAGRSDSKGAVFRLKLPSG